MHQDHLITDPDNLIEDTCAVCGEILKPEEDITWSPSGFGWPDWKHVECPVYQPR